MLVATPGQTTSYSTLHNNSSNGSGGNNSTAATTTTKKCSTSTNASGTVKTLNNNNNHTTSSVNTKSSLNSNINSTTYNCNLNSKNDNIVLNKLGNQNKSTAASSRDIISLSKQAAATHSLKTENSTNTTSTTNIKQQSFIQTLKDSVQKALISTTGSTSNSNSIAKKYSSDNKLQNNCNNSTTSINNVTSSSSSTSHNANKVSTTTSSNNSSNSTAATQSASSASAVRSKHFSCSLSKLHTVAPTTIHRYPEERQHASSTDSLQKEMCHFKPIRIVPKTPWKSGSKSRGNFLRFPKANLATKNDFVLKSNCDVNNRKKRQQKNRTKNDQIIIAEGEDDNEQENKEFHGIYKPKPSLTCLSTSFTTPNHQSAFVCLVAQMKNLVNLQSKNQLSVKSAGTNAGDVSDKSIKELYIRKKPAKKQHIEVETNEYFPKTRGTRQSSNVKNKRVSDQTSQAGNAKLNNISKVSMAAIAKSKSSRKLGRDKSKTINLVSLAVEKAKEKLQNSKSMPAVASVSRNSRKRKIAHEDDCDEDQNELISTSSTTQLPTKTTSVKSLSSRPRKSSRLSTMEINAPTIKLNRYFINQNFKQTTVKTSQKPEKNRTAASFSPPMTRSRLKQLVQQGKLVTPTVTDIKKSKI